MRRRQADAHVRLAMNHYLRRVTRVGLIVSRCACCLSVSEVRESEPRFAGVSDGICRSVDCLMDLGLSMEAALRHLQRAA